MIYDCFTFFNELDILELRLNILDPYVDRFLLVEAGETFSGRPKPFFYSENEKRFRKWRKKIIHIRLNMRVGTDDAFERAFIQKERIKSSLEGFARDDDVIYYGDVDEIWSPTAIPDEVSNLEQLNYGYYLNQRSSERWVGTIVGRWGKVKKNTLAHWRATHTYEIKNGGWHFTNMGGIEQIIKKLEAYDHQENNTDDVLENLEYNMTNGHDYVGRELDWENKPFHYWTDESEWPRYLRDHRKKYQHLCK
jgi:hypothetical protein